MSESQGAVHGLSWAHFKSICADVNGWTWGTVQGAFNEKASFSQIIVDAVIGMIPVAGDVTAVRDLIATIIGLVDNPKKRESTWQWIILVVFILALIPVFGGVAKGVGRITCKVFEDAAKLAGNARAKALAAGAQEVIAFLNRIGVRHAERWIKSFRIADHQAAILDKFNAVTNALYKTLGYIKESAGYLMPTGMGQRIEGLRAGLQQLKAKGAQMIPLAIKEFDQDLRELQAYIRTGGETTSRVALHEVATGQRGITRAEEARLIEDGALPVRSASGGWAQNAALAHDPELGKIYKPEPDYPDLTKKVEDGRLTTVATYSGRIANRLLKQDEEIFRVFGTNTTTHGVEVDETFAGGAFWGVGEAPKTAEEWRMVKGAVLDEWNGDGFIITGKVGANGPKACVGTIAEQSGKKLPGQYEPGGGTQAFFFMHKDAQAEITKRGQEVIADGRPRQYLDLITGTVFTIRPTGWKDANGIWGYVRAPGVKSVTVARLGNRELANKQSHEVTVEP